MKLRTLTAGVKFKLLRTGERFVFIRDEGGLYVKVRKLDTHKITELRKDCLVVVE